MEELKSYMFEFDKNGAMKAKEYLDNCAMRGNKCQPVIIITHDECTFFTNDGIHKTWT